MLREKIPAYKNEAVTSVVLSNYKNDDLNTVYLQLVDEYEQPVTYYRGILSIAGGYSRGDYRGVTQYSIVGYREDGYATISMLNDGFMNYNSESISITPQLNSTIKIKLIGENQTVGFSFSFITNDNLGKISQRKNGRNVYFKIVSTVKEPIETDKINNLVVRPDYIYSRYNVSQEFTMHPKIDFGRQLVYKKGGISIYRLQYGLGLLVFNSAVSFNRSTQVGNTYKYYSKDFTTNPECNIAEVSNICNLWCGISLEMVNKDHHNFVFLSTHGLVQCVGNGTWNVTGYGIVQLFENNIQKKKQQLAKIINITSFIRKYNKNIINNKEVYLYA